MLSRPRLQLERPTGPIAFLGAWLVIYALLVLLVPTREAPWPLVFDSAYMPFRITTALVLWMASKRSTDPAIKRAWLLLTIGQVFAVAGNSTWVISDLTGTETENITYLAWTIPQNIFTLWGFWQMMRPRDARMARRGDWVDAAVLVAACATIAWYFLAARLVSTAYEDATGVFLFFFDTTSNDAILLFAATVWLRSPRGVARAAMPHTVIGLLILLTGDLVIEEQLMGGTYLPGSALDLWYASGVIFLALGAHAQCRDPQGATAPPPNHDRADALVFGAVGASLIPLVVEIASTDIRTNGFAASALGVLILMLLVLWRQRLARSEIGVLIANRVQLEHQLWQAQKLDAVGRLAAGIAHDFNNILAVISSHAQQLRHSPGQATAAAEAAEIEFATERAAVLVRRLLTFSSAATPDRKPVVLGDVVSSMQPMLRQLPVPGVTLETSIDDERATVRLADGQLEQVLLNLAINARDATPAGGQIRVRTGRVSVHPRAPLHRKGISPGVWALLEVVDTGVGMDRATQQKLFEPFFTTKANTGGTGLGLATVAGIVHSAEGHILVESAPGAGTTMSVYLPLAIEQEASEAGRRRHTPPGGARSGTILIVDDELPIRSALARYLSRLGYRVIEAADAAQAYSQMEQHDWRVDLVLTDVRMPDTTGLDMADRLHERAPTLPILFMSGQAETPVRAGPNGVPPRDDTIDKPFDLQVVAERVRSKLAAAAR
jgi:signal transduction histidine kinase/CheY-like chemotaxis protein